MNIGKIARRSECSKAKSRFTYLLRKMRFIGVLVGAVAAKLELCDYLSLLVTDSLCGFSDAYIIGGRFLWRRRFCLFWVHRCSCSHG